MVSPVTSSSASSVCPSLAGMNLALAFVVAGLARNALRSEEHTSELQSLMRISYAVFCLKKKTTRPHRRPIKTEKKHDLTLDIQHTEDPREIYTLRLMLKQ